MKLYTIRPINSKKHAPNSPMFSNKQDAKAARKGMNPVHIDISGAEVERFDNVVTYGPDHYLYLHSA